MVPALLIIVREGFEASLIVALVFAYLRKIDRLDMAKATWLGVAAAIAISIAVGVGLHLSVGGLTGDARLRSFGAISLLAAGVLTWMVFWMRRQARAIKSELEHKVDLALQSTSTASRWPWWRSWPSCARGSSRLCSSWRRRPTPRAGWSCSVP